eukprot:8782509-Karenia_brevis.AAC.1
MGEFKGLMWIKFASEELRNSVVRTLGPLRLQHGSSGIWINRDRPVEERCQMSYLYAIKKLMVTWEFAKGSLWVDENTRQLYWNEDVVTSTSVRDGELHVAFGSTWQDFLQEGNIDEIYDKANASLQKSLRIKSKGKGKGKSKAKGSSTINIDWQDY